MTFWIIIALTALAVVAIFVRAALHGRAGDVHSAAFDLQIYRDQLKEVERDLARGVISEDDAERVRIEVSRRVLAADTQAKSGDDKATQPKSTVALVGLLAAALVLGGSLLLYRQIGTPGYTDLPIAARIAASDEMRANRMTQAEAEARVPETSQDPEASEDFLELMEKLRQTVAERPDDLRGLDLLARNEAALGNTQAAIDAQARIIELRGDQASADDYTFLAELKIGAVSGYVSQEAEAALRKALEIDPRAPFARYYLAQYLMQVDRPDAAFRTLDALLRDSTPDAPWVPSIREQIGEVAWRAGVDYELPPLEAGTGPSPEDMANAQDMSPEERQQMIVGMVGRLSDRLASEGGPPEDWARLIRALGVLEDTAQADVIWKEAKQVFDGNPEALETLRRAAFDAGVVQ